MTFLERLGRFEARHATLVALGWVAAVVVAFGLALGAFGGALAVRPADQRRARGARRVPGRPRPAGRPARRRPGRWWSPWTASTRRPRRCAAAVQELHPALGAGPGRLEGQRRRTRARAGRPAPAGRSLVGHGRARPRGHRAARRRPVPRPESDRAHRRDRASGRGGRRHAARRPARTTSVPQLVDEITHQVELDLRRGEGIALPISLLVMVLVFGGFLAAGLPLAGAIASIAGGLAVAVGVLRRSSTWTPPWSTSSRSSGSGCASTTGCWWSAGSARSCVPCRGRTARPSREQVVDAVGSDRRDRRAHRAVLRADRGDQPVRADALPGPDPARARRGRGERRAGGPAGRARLRPGAAGAGRDPAGAAGAARPACRCCAACWPGSGDVAPPEGVFSRLARTGAAAPLAGRASG